MKRRVFLAIFVMAVATIISVAVVSCKKDNETQKTKTLASASTESDNMDEYLSLNIVDILFWHTLVVF